MLEYTLFRQGWEIKIYSKSIQKEQIPQVSSLPFANIYQQYHQHETGGGVHSWKSCMVCLSGGGCLGEQLLHFQPHIQLDHTGLAHEAQYCLKQAKKMKYLECAPIT